MDMSNLWDLSHLQPREDIVVDGETVATMFWNAVGRRGDKVFMRQKKLGIWREWTWNQTAQAVREIGDGLLALGLGAGECASIASNTVIEWVLADLAVLSCGGVSNGIYRRSGRCRSRHRRRCSTCAKTRAPASCSSRTKSNSTKRSRCAINCRCCA
jgi:long-subunit acyl-CoA synthetase (AMP-forming)